MKHKWKSFFMANEPILPARCSVCKEISMCSADWCDSRGIVKWIEKIINRDDCPGELNAKTKVVHCRREPYDVMIDRTTQFGNPFPLSKYSRPESILQYSVWFYRQLELQPGFKEAVLKLKGLTLGCWCKPKACHGDVIVEYLEG